MSEGPLIVFEAVEKIYFADGLAVPVLQGINLAIRRGEFVVLLGPSGSGKTTLLNLAAGLDTPSAGRVTVDGEEISAATAAGRTLYRRQKVGLVFQFYNLLPTLTALENVEAALEVAGLRGGPARARSVQWLARVGLAGKEHKFPAQLSGGEQQRVAIARALAKEPPLVLADEPTGNLDGRTGAQIARLLDQLRRDTGATLIVVTHNRNLTALATRVLELVDGRVAEEWAAGEGKDPAGANDPEGAELCANSG